MDSSRWTEARAREVLEAWRASGKSMRGFALGRGLRVQRLAWWRDRLGDWEQAPRLVPAMVRERSAFAGGVRVQVGVVVVEAESAEALPVEWLAALSQALSR